MNPIKITYRNPVTKGDFINLWLNPLNNAIARDWYKALHALVETGEQIEKNYSFHGFCGPHRDLDYLCNELNRHVETINKAMIGYIIDDWYHPNTVMFGGEYPCRFDRSKPSGKKIGSYREEYLGLQKKDSLNKLHNHFEVLQGTVEEPSTYYENAGVDVRYAIRQLNLLCHEMETWILSHRKQQTEPYWQRPSQITTMINAPRYDLTDEHRELFAENRYDRKFGRAYMHWCQIGKTMWEVFRDENAPALTIGDDPTYITSGEGTTCEAITALRYYSGEFDIEFGNSVTRKDDFHQKEYNEFNKWLTDNNVSNDDPKLSLGYLPLADIDFARTFGKNYNFNQVIGSMRFHLDIYAIQIEDVSRTYNDCWSDPGFEAEQKFILRRGYEG